MYRRSFRHACAAPLGAAALCLCFSAGAQPLATAPAPAPAPAAVAFTSAADQYLNLIREQEDSVGSTAPGLVEPLAALGQHYFAQEDYEQAFATFARARQILRANAGFDTPGELPLVAQLVRAEEGRGRLEQAWELEESLVALAEKNIGRPEALPVLRALADKRLALLETYRTGEIPPQIVLGCYYNRRDHVRTMGGQRLLVDTSTASQEQCNAGDRRVVRLALLIEARRYQMQAIETLLQNNGYASAELWALFTEMQRTSFAIMARAVGSSDAPLADMMTRLLSYEPRDRAERVRRAEILLRLADMNVLRSREFDRYVGYDAVPEQYRQAWSLLREEGVDEAELAVRFAPELPVVLPTFTANPLVAPQADTNRYIDVSFEISRQGKPRRIETTGTSAGVERSERRALEQLIYRSTFRPRLVDGVIMDSAPVSLRYYLPEAPKAAAEQ